MQFTKSTIAFQAFLLAMLVVAAQAQGKSLTPLSFHSIWLFLLLDIR